MPAQYEGPVTDACVAHIWPSIVDLTAYVSDGWRAIVERPGDLGGPMDPSTKWIFREPKVGIEAAATPTAYSGVVSVLDRGGRTRVVLGYHDGLLLTGSPYHHAAHALVAAANDWTAEHWLAMDDRLYGMILIQNALPDLAAEEIKRSGTNEKMVAVAMGANGLGRSFGHPCYHDIYRAACDTGLPIVLQVGSDACTDQITPPVAGGLPACFGEYRAMGGQPIMAHLVSMVVEGVFDLFPSLRVLIMGTGAAWIPPYVWRIDSWYKILMKEAPWLRRLPSEYITEHVRVSTWGLEAPPRLGDLERALSTLPELESMLIYSSGYPATDAEEPEQIASRLPATWLQNVFYCNARDLFRWPGVTTRPTPGIYRAQDYLQPSHYAANQSTESAPTRERSK